MARNLARAGMDARAWEPVGAEGGAAACRGPGAVALDLGAAAGGFTQALLDAARVYAVDAGSGQLRGWLRAGPRVTSLERANLAQLNRRLIGEPVDLMTMDLSYLAVADAIGQVGRRLRAPAAGSSR
jgi:23S rRNA (cytidine1920-2'-O)/16S rRNA (cytidine1409-2'-O)-methyltransferase